MISVSCEMGWHEQCHGEYMRVHCECTCHQQSETD